MKTARIFSGLILLAIGGLSLFGFKTIGKYFLFLSQDGSVVPHSMLQLRICLVTLAVIGLYLIFRESFNRLLMILDGYVMRLTLSEFIKLSLLVALVLRVIVVLILEFHLWIDYQTYDELGWLWAATGAYYIDGHPTAYRPPGYPFFLSRLYLIFGHHPQLGAIANIFFSMVIVWLGCLIARKIWNEEIARWTMIILAFFPSQLLFVNLLATEPLFTALFLISIYLFILSSDGISCRWYHLFIGGLILGLTTLTRPLTMVFPIILIIFWYLKSRNLSVTVKKSIIAIIGFLIIIAPWMVRNYYLKGTFAISTNSGINFLIGNQPGSGMGWNQPVTDEFAIGDPTQETYIDSVGWHRGWQYIKADPIGFVKRGVLKVMYFYAVDMEGVGYELVRAADEDRFDCFVLLAFITESYYIMILLFGFLGLFAVYFRSHSLRCPGGFLFWATILFWTMVHFVFFADGRFHFPIIPMISAFAAIYIRHSLPKTS